MFTFLHRWFTDSTVDLDGLNESEVERAINAAIDNTDARLRLVGGYQRKLRPAVIEALLHARELIHQIPGPIEVSRSTYAHDPLVNILFGSAKQVDEVFGLSAEAQDFKKQAWLSGQGHLYGLLLMTLNEKTRPGYVLKGDMVQGDVMQDTVYFSDHTLVKVASCEDEVRTRLRERAFESMLREFTRRIAAHTKRTAELKREQARLLRELGQTGYEAFDDETRVARNLAEVEGELEVLAQDLIHVDNYLDLLVSVLTNPEEHCGLEHRELQLDRNGVNLGAVTEDSHGVSYAEITVGEVQRAGVLVKYPLEELSAIDRLEALYRMNF